MNTTKKPIFSIVSIICLVASYPMARIIVDIYAPKEDYLGYGALSLALLVLLSVLTVGLILGIVSFVRKEQPKLLPIAALSLNGLPLVWLATKIPL